MQRYHDYVSDLQTFVYNNGLSSEDTVEILDWVSQNRNIYLFVYNEDDVLLVDSSVQKPEKDEDEKESDSSQDDVTENPGEDGVEEGTETEGGSEDSREEDTEKEPSEEPEKESEKENNYAGGLIIQYPTPEEIKESAKKNSSMPLIMSDGEVLRVSIADFTEYIYYDVAIIVSIAVGVLVLTIVLMLYFQNILTKISVLAKDVSMVYEVDMNSPIRTREGNDELAELTRNVEEMRSSMIQSLEKEKEAINSNTELITSMSHDIRTPLTVLLGYLDVMKNSTDDKAMQEYIKASEVTTMRLKNLSDDMFRYFLVFGGDIDVDLATYSAKTLFDQFFTEHMFLLTEKGYLVDASGIETINTDIYVRTDAPKMMRVVDNVFSNIYKYADKDEKICVNSCVENESITITVSNRIAKLVNEVESNNVGLKTCKKLCEAMGADFEFGDIDGNTDLFTVKIVLPIAKDWERAENET